MPKFKVHNEREGELTIAKTVPIKLEVVVSLDKYRATNLVPDPAHDSTLAPGFKFTTYELEVLSVLAREELGRRMLNLGLDVEEVDETTLPKDLLAMADALIKMSRALRKGMTQQRREA